MPLRQRGGGDLLGVVATSDVLRGLFPQPQPSPNVRG